ncbi:hypothetical protein [Streptomyces sp. NPDC058872]|uniref:hypothetical protein n=1 Tax=Streptomyces sp. NPDC058872 TaxID=3346661 RepID=UPI0036953DAE
MISTRIARTTAVLVCALAALLLPSAVTASAQEHAVSTGATAQPLGDTVAVAADFGWQ